MCLLLVTLCEGPTSLEIKIVTRDLRKNKLFTARTILRAIESAIHFAQLVNQIAFYFCPAHLSINRVK